MPKHVAGRTVLDLDGGYGESLRTYVSFVLDKSGSMAVCKAQVLSGYAEYLMGLRGQPDVFFSLTTFNTACEAVHVVVPVAGVPDLTEATYVPEGGTALLDSVMETVRALEAALPTSGAYRVLVVIMTDGEENSSRTATKEEVAALVAAKEALGNWTFVYLGAGQDAWAEAAMLGVAAGNTMAYAAAATGQTFQSLSAATVCYVGRSSTGTQAFYADAGQGQEKYGRDVVKPGTQAAIAALKAKKAKRTG